uniref:Variant surface glycoprotein 1004 n=1 Tax=Trypanosoma brucei TaxID=5691 RepID=M4SVB0_9TRYP|nr:variant surface glycoprotein 1004 [Trypanosoma brucei]
MFQEVVTAIIFAVSSAQAAHENVKEIRDMCGLYGLLIQPIADSQIVSTDGTTKENPRVAMQTVIRKIIDLNLTVIEKPVAEALAQKTPYPDANKLKTEQSDVKSYFKELDVSTITTMIESSKDLAEKMKTSGEIGKKFALSLYPTTQLKLRKALAHLTTEALKKQASLNTSGHYHGEKTGNPAENGKGTLRPATKPATSDQRLISDTEYKTVPAEDTFPWEGTDRDDTCEQAATASAKKAGQALATDMIYLCSVQANSGGDDFCGEGSTGNANAIHTSGQVAKPTAMWGAIVKQRDALDGVKARRLTPAALATALTAIFSHLGKNYIALTGAPTQTALVDKRRHFLGFHTVYNTSPTCKAPANTTTTASKGVCIDYSVQIQDAKGIPWVALVKQAASDLEAIQADFEGAKNIVGAAEANKTTMEGLLQIAPFVGTNSGSLAENTDKIPEPTTTLQHKCKAKNKTADECPSEHCVYDEKATGENKCKPKVGSETTAEGASEAEKEGAATAGCAAHKDKTTCENEKNGKSNCA